MLPYDRWNRILKQTWPDRKIQYVLTLYRKKSLEELRDYVRPETVERMLS